MCLPPIPDQVFCEPFLSLYGLQHGHHCGQHQHGYQHDWDYQCHHQVEDIDRHQELVVSVGDMNTQISSCCPRHQMARSPIIRNYTIQVYISNQILYMVVSYIFGIAGVQGS